MDAADLSRLAADLRAGRLIADLDFDRLYPRRLRRLSTGFWTPIAVAARASVLLAGGGAARVLDVGSGVGKLCIVGALVTRASFTGLEERRDRLDAARRAAAALGLTGVTWVHGRLEDIAFEGFDAFYFFNPFAEVLVPGPDGLPDPAGQARCDHDIARAQAALASARPGARVVTYHGLGGPMPPGYRLVTREVGGTGPIECWEKAGATPPAG